MAGVIHAGAGPCASTDRRDPARPVRSRAQARPAGRRARPRAAGIADSDRHLRRCRTTLARRTPDLDPGRPGQGASRNLQRRNHNVGGATLR
nr:hypothetical protein [Xanthomonas arboricola]